MKDGGRLQAAIEVLEALEREHRPATEVLRDWGNAHRFAGSGDRAAIGNLVHDALRARASLAWRMGSAAPRALVLATYVRLWGRDIATLEAHLSGDQHAPAPLEDAERAALGADEAEGAPDHVRGDYPEWLAPSFARVFADRAVAEGRALSARAPVDLRANTLKSGRNKMLAALSRFGAVPTAIAPQGIRLPAGDGPARAPQVQAEPGYKKGWFEIQDEGSQLAALLAGARGGDQVADVCAGGGGKTLALSAAMANKGQIHAFDADRNRLAGIFERLDRAGTRNVQVIPANERARLEAMAGRMDVVLVDAPCTGTGTWRRRPDAKWRLSEKQLADRIADQQEVLALAEPLVKPGGRLVYVTCSVLPEENEDQVAAFLATHPGYRLQPAAEVWRTALDTALPDEFRAPVEGHGEAIRLTPATAGTDGFFVAVMVRAA
ncbi:MAG: RsmB/NOP family class I SAM-dependent RNA methyltransferase [Hyphomicrobiales bacterium]